MYGAAVLQTLSLFLQAFPQCRKAISDTLKMGHTHGLASIIVRCELTTVHRNVDSASMKHLESSISNFDGSKATTLESLALCTVTLSPIAIKAREKTQACKDLDEPDSQILGPDVAKLWIRRDSLYISPILYLFVRSRKRLYSLLYSQTPVEDANFTLPWWKYHTSKIGYCSVLSHAYTSDPQISSFILHLHGTPYILICHSSNTYDLYAFVFFSSKAASTAPLRLLWVENAWKAKVKVLDNP